MKIAHIVCTYPPYNGGMGNVVFEMASHLAGLGHEVEVFTPDYYRPEEIKSLDEDSEVLHEEKINEQIDYARRLKPKLTYGNAAYMPSISRELDSFDLVHLHYPFFGTANLVRKWKLKNPKKPLVVTYHMDNREVGLKGLFFKFYAKYWLPKILGSADVLIGSSFDYIKNSDARKLFEEQKEKWVEMPFGVDLERFMPREKPLELFKRHDLNPELPTLLFVGGMDRAHYFKGLPVLIKALTILKHRKINLQTILVGDGDLKVEFENQVKFYGLQDNVCFTRKVSNEELPYYYNMADLFVLPSTTVGEAFGMVLLEAMASGVPVIASDLPGVRTVAEGAGTVVNPNNPQELAELITEFFNTPDENWSIKCRQLVEDKYNWQILMEKMENIYKNIVR